MTMTKFKIEELSKISSNWEPSLDDVQTETSFYKTTKTEEIMTPNNEIKPVGYLGEKKRSRQKKNNNHVFCHNYRRSTFFVYSNTCICNRRF